MTRPETRTRTVGRATAIAAPVTALALVLLTAGAAHAATPIVQEHYSNVFDVLLGGPDDPDGFCGGAVRNVPLHGEEQGYFSVKDRGSSPSPYFADRFRSTYMYTNPRTGLTLTVVKVRQSKDLRIIDNGDGTLTITAMQTGVRWTYGPDGELLGSERGLSRETFLVDTLGNTDPDDDQFTPVGEPFLAGQHGGSTFCDDFLTATSA